MGFRQRNIIGFVYDVGGFPITGGKITAKVTLPIGYTDTHIVADRVIQIQTSLDGSFILPVWCDEDSLIPIDILINFPINNNGSADPTHTKTVSLFYEDGTDKDIGTLIAETANLPPSDDSSFGELVDARIETKGTPLTDYAVKFTPAQVWHGGTIDHNLFFDKFFTPSAVLGNCHWEFQFISYTTNTQGVICDVGHGGNHPVLLESIGNTTDQHLFGNMYNGSTNIDASGIDNYKNNALHYGAYRVVGQYLCIYLDGILTAKTLFTGSRTVGGNALDGILYLGASGEHQGFSGEILRARGFEVTNGHGLPFGNSVIPQCFTPQKVFGDTWDGVESVFNWDGTKPSNKAVDTSSGYNGVKHSGFGSIGTGSQILDGAALPAHVLRAFEYPTYQGTPLTIPVDAEFFDDFSDDNQTQFTKSGVGAYAPSISNRDVRLGSNWLSTSPSYTTSNIGILEGRACSVEGDINAAASAVQRLGASSPNYRIDIDFDESTGGSIFVRRDTQTSPANQLQISLGTSILFVVTKAGVTTFEDGGVISGSYTSAYVECSGSTVTVHAGASTVPRTDSGLASGTYWGMALGALQRCKSFKAKTIA